MYRFDSDYLEGCCPEILEALTATNLEQTPGYGRDIHCQRAKELIAQACGGDPDVHFLVGGTQTNITVIDSLLRPYQGVLCAVTGHINGHETGALEHTGHKALILPSSDGKVRAEDVRAALSDHFRDPLREHSVQPAMLYISFPTELGTIYSKSELESLGEVCREWGIPLFIDGARLGYGLTCPECDLTLKDIARLADVFYIGGTKQGALFGEAVVFRNKKLSEDFRYDIKQNCGLLAKGRLLGIQFERLFTDDLYFRAAKNAIEKAAVLRNSLKEKGYSFYVDSPTNQLFPILDNERISALEKQFGFEIWARVDEARSVVRFVTSWATTSEAVSALCAAL